MFENPLCYLCYRCMLYIIECSFVEGSKRNMEGSTLSIREFECVYHGMVSFQNQCGSHRLLILFWEGQVRSRCSNHDSSLSIGIFSSSAACFLFLVICINLLPSFLQIDPNCQQCNGLCKGTYCLFESNVSREKSMTNCLGNTQ